MRPRNAYKYMLNNLVSLIGHVAINHQNQTRTNDLWGHVRYSCALSGKRCSHRQRGVNSDFGYIQICRVLSSSEVLIGVEFAYVYS
jgi:hypothetical protein